MGVLIKPVITEKMTMLTERRSQYAFVTEKSATKAQIKKEVEEMYSVTVEWVNTLIVAGKAKSRYTKTGVLSGRTKSYKKAIVQVADGDSIDFYSEI